jgi:3-oxoacyl-[acyl-carrier-protein] synthase-1
MTRINEIFITGANCVTALDRDGDTAPEAFYSDKGMIAFDDERDDEHGRPIKTAVIERMDEWRGLDEAGFVAAIAGKCLSDLCRTYFDGHDKVENLFLFMGYPSKYRPGPRFEGDGGSLAGFLAKILEPFAENVHFDYFRTGHASVFHGVEKAESILARYRDAVCIAGGADSLLSPETLSWFEKDGRLVSETPGRGHGLFPSQAAGFFIMESLGGTKKRKKQPLSKITGYALIMEPAPFVSENPCTGEGLTEAILKALERSREEPGGIGSVFCDLNGEYHRFREWGFADVRCFPDGDHSPRLIHPAESMGDMGAAFLPVLVNIANEGFKRDLAGEKALVFCSDDHGERGAMVMVKG